MCKKRERKMYKKRERKNVQNSVKIKKRVQELE